MVIDASLEVDASNVHNILNAFRLAPEVAERLLVKHGLGRINADGTFESDPSPWYPLGPWLEVYREIAEVGGAEKLFEAGQLVPQYAVFPPTVRDPHAAIRALDVAYHLNHRKGGQIMFDLATGQMLEGIGHYTAEVQHLNTITARCENPYPCDFDRGLLVGLAASFQPGVTVAHAEGACRHRGDASCRYVLRW